MLSFDQPQVRHSFRLIDTAGQTVGIVPPSMTNSVPVIEEALAEATWHWNRSHMTAFTLQVENCSVLLSLLDMFYFQVNGFMPPECAGQHYGQQCSITFAFQPLAIRCLP